MAYPGATYTITHTGNEQGGNRKKDEDTGNGSEEQSNTLERRPGNDMVEEEAETLEKEGVPDNTEKTYKSAESVINKLLGGKELNTANILNIMACLVVQGRSYSQITKIRTVANKMAKRSDITLDQDKLGAFCKGARARIRKQAKTSKQAAPFILEELMEHLKQDEEIDIQTKAAIMTQSTFALRFESMCSMEPDHVRVSKDHITRITVAVEKRKHDQVKMRNIRQVPRNTNEVVEYTAKLLRDSQRTAREKGEKYLFSGNRLIDYGSYNDLIKQIAKEMGKGGSFSTHSCRRTGAIFWIGEGASIPTVCYIGGWQQATTLLHYIDSAFGFQARQDYERRHGPLNILYA